MKTTALLLFFCAMYLLYLYSTSTTETELLVLSMCCVLFCLFIIIDEIATNINTLTKLKN